MANAQWLFSASAIANSPSVAAGLTPADERARRAKGVNFIVQAGMLLKVPQVTLGSAAVFFHRFYMRVGMVGERGVHHYVSLDLVLPAVKGLGGGVGGEEW